MSAVQEISLKLIDESESNPRKQFGNLEDLAEDIKRRGLLQPILVRPNGDERYELVFGTRRFRAAKIAKLEALPALVRPMGDQEALETQIVENSKREDVHPLEECDGYRALHEKYSLGVEEIAAKVGMSRAYVYGRMKLSELARDGRKAFLDGDISASLALLVARIPSEASQREVLDEIDDARLSVREAEQWIQANFMLRLKGAPFSITDAALYPEAGACSTCPKRTGNQRELFPEVKSADVCTDPACFAVKRERLFARRLEEAATTGQTVMDPERAKKVFPDRYSGPAKASGYVELDATYYQSPKSSTWRELLGKKGLADVEIVMVQHPHKGDMVELVKEKGAIEVLKRKGVKWLTKRSQTPSAAKERTKRKIDLEVGRRTIAQLVERVDALKLTPKVSGVLRMIAISGTAELWHETKTEIARRRGLLTPKATLSDADRKIRSSLESAGAGAILGWIVEILMSREAYQRTGPYQSLEPARSARWRLI